MEPILAFDRASVFFDGALGSTRLNHPEGLAIATDCSVWCGGEEGEIYRIEPDGSSIDVVASTGGFTLGMAFDAKGRLYTCDLGEKAVFRLDPGTGNLELFSSGGGGSSMRIPNYPAVDHSRSCLYVSDSYDFSELGPGIWRLDLESGEGELWYDQPLRFANGLALSLDRQWLYVVETFAHKVSRIPILQDGSAGSAETFIANIERLPDGIAFDSTGDLYISCYEPSRVFRVTPDKRIELLFDDPDAHTLCHPTNCAFRGADLLTSNLGRWHITKIAVGRNGAPLL